MLSAKNLTVSFYTKKILDNVSISFDSGKITAILGLNGAGKTTLLKSIIGFYKVNSGRVLADDNDLIRMSPANRAKWISYVPQHQDGGFSYYTEEFVSMGITAYLGAFSRPDKATVDRALDIMSNLGCEELAGRRMNQLSGGERKMMYLARSILQSSKYILMDEPVASLDFARQHVFFGMIREHVKNEGFGVVTTIHEPWLAYKYADRIVILNGGQIIFDVSKEDSGYEMRLESALCDLYGRNIKITYIDEELYMGWK